MAYVDIGDFAPDDVLTAADLDQIRANFQAGVPDIYTTKGDLAVATAANAAARLPAGANDSILVYASGEATGMATQIVPAVHLTKSDATNMTEDDWTSIEFDTETSDTNAMHSTVTNPERLTVPTGGDGWYLFGFFGTKTENSPDRWAVRILLNGTTVIGQTAVSTSAVSSLCLTAGYSLAATNYIEVQYYTEDPDGIISAGPRSIGIYGLRCQMAQNAGPALMLPSGSSV